MGLHQLDYPISHVRNAYFQERQNICYCLYVLDKVVCWTTGASPSILATDFQILPATQTIDNGAISFLSARAMLAEIEETIYLEIFSRQAGRKTEEHVHHLVSRVRARLHDWATDAGVDVEDQSNGEDRESASKVDLCVSFCNAQLLLTWPFRNHPKFMSQRKDLATKCIKLILRLWHSGPDSESHMILSR